MSDAKFKAGDVLLTEYGDAVEMLVFSSSFEAHRSEFPIEYVGNVMRAAEKFLRDKEKS